MFLELNNRDPDQIATGYLLRERRKIPFNYCMLDKARKVTRNEPMEGLISFQVNMSIKTNDDLKFAFGDKVILEEIDQPMTVVGLTKKVNEKQYMFLNTAVDVEYTLDLVW